MKLNKSEKILVLIISVTFLATIIWIFLAFILNNHILSYMGLLIFLWGSAISILFNGIYLPFILKRHPYVENPEEIKDLKEFLGTEEVKKIIKNLYHNRGRNVYEIAWMLEKNLNIELHVKKGLQAGEIKSGSLYLRIDHILGVNTQDFWKSTISYYYQKPISHYIRDIFILLSLVGGIISLLLMIFFNI